MTGAAALFVALAAVAAVLDWIAVDRRVAALEYMAKPAVMVMLAGAVLTLVPVDGTVRTLVLAGLLLSLVGDIALMLPGRKGTDRDTLFLVGLSSFLAAHVAYVAALVTRGQDAVWFAAGLAAVALSVLVVGTRILRAVRSGDRGRSGDSASLVGPVTAYLAVISLMVATAFGTGNGFAIGGAVLFYASDALLAWNRFVREHPHGRVAVHVTYHLGQLGIVLSVI